MTATTTFPTHASLSETTSSGWRRLYTLGGVAALLAVLVAVADILLTFHPAGAEQPGTMTAVNWFDLFQTSWFFGLRNLGLLPNILTLLLLIPVFLALFASHRRTQPAFGSLALFLFLLGAGIYLSNNAAFPMLALSAKYAAASTEGQRSALAAAGEAILARGEDFTPGSCAGILLEELAIAVISVVMLRGRIFSRAAAYTGILGGLLMAIFTIWATFIPVLFEVSLLLAVVAGLCYIAWYILTARTLFHLGSRVNLEE